MEKDRRTVLLLFTLSIFFSLGCSIAGTIPDTYQGKALSPNVNSSAITPQSTVGTVANEPTISSPQFTSNTTTTSPITTPPPPPPPPPPKPITTTSTTVSPLTTPHPITSTPSPTTSAPTTSSPITSTITPGPAPTPSPKPDRSFDLPSFVGGIILALGILAIGYVVYKFYRARTDPNYRTL